MYIRPPNECVEMKVLLAGGVSLAEVCYHGLIHRVPTSGSLRYEHDDC